MKYLKKLNELIVLNEPQSMDVYFDNKILKIISKYISNFDSLIFEYYKSYTKKFKLKYKNYSYDSLTNIDEDDRNRFFYWILKNFTEYELRMDNEIEFLLYKTESNIDYIICINNKIAGFIQGDAFFSINLYKKILNKYFGLNNLFHINFIYLIPEFRIGLGRRLYKFLLQDQKAIISDSVMYGMIMLWIYPNIMVLSMK